jgi:hypothetical protein
MKRIVLSAAVIAMVGIGGAATWAVVDGKASTCSKDAGACGPASCGAGAKSASVVKPSSKVIGNFDPAMVGCRFACATKLKYDAKSVVAQPGVKDGKLTQCPVSGVVFNADAKRPRVRVGSDEYVTCCDACARKLRKNPSRFLRL